MKRKVAVCSIVLLSSVLVCNISVAEPQKGKHVSHLSKFINKFDVNGDNEVSKEEFDKAMLQRFKGLCPR